MGFVENLGLITDRTKADTSRVASFFAKGFDRMTEAEKAEFLSGMKGAYSASDFNRVESAVKILSQLLQELPEEIKQRAEALGVYWNDLYEVPYDPDEYGVNVKTDWTASDYFKDADKERYIENVRLVCSALEYERAALPEKFEGLSWKEANNIEQALLGLNEAITRLRNEKIGLIDNTAATWYFSGEVYTGEVQG